MRAGRRKPLARLTASKHAPTARFRRLPRRVSARGTLKVGWTARDRDRDRLSVVLQGRRGKGRWKTVTLGPARGKASLQPRTLGAGKRLRLRLLVSDGLRTSVVNARPIAVRGR
jgi:hypothetical protein